MASKERIKKKLKSPSPAVSRKRQEKIKIEIPAEKKIQEDDEPEDVQGSQVSVRSATEENIKDNTHGDPDNIINDEIERKSPAPQPSSTSPRVSSSETKKKRKDHVDQKLGKDSALSPSQALSPREKKNRSQSPMQRKNNVRPLNEVTSPMGSAVSLRSNVSRTSREAWVEDQEDQDGKVAVAPPVVKGSDVESNRKTTVTLKKKGPGPGRLPLSKDNRVAPEEHISSSSNKKVKGRPTTSTSLVSLQETAEDDASVKDGFKGVKVDIEEDSPEKHAYIPYLYSRNCISKIMEDMQAMKGNHVVIVEKIQHQYSMIETETQEQFNMFVICMKEEYANKRKTFRQVIDVHREEVEKKEKYWNEMLQSLAERNNRLLKEKKMLLVMNKTEIEKYEKEKGDLTKEFTEKIDKMAVAPVPVPVGWEEEKKILTDQLDGEKVTVAHLQDQLANQSFTASPIEANVELATVETHEMTAAGAGVVGGVVALGAIAVTKENNKQMDKERKDMEEQRMRMTEERTQLNEEREEFGGERKKWLDEISNLQTQLAEGNVNGNEWKVKHDILKSRLEEVATVQAKYQALENQYAALAMLVKNTDTTAALQEQKEKTAEEKKMMAEEKTGIEKQIQKFEKDFEKKNGRKPTDDDKSDSVKEMYTTHGELEFMVASLEQKESTYKQVENGTVPDPPEVPHKPVDTTDPEVVTVQVKVPDPTIVKELENYQQKVVTVKTEITVLKTEITTLRSEISKQNEDLSKQRSTIAELENQVATLREGGSVPMAIPASGSGLSEEELEALKKENRELRRDMKKMIKQYTRLAERKGAEGGDDSEQMNEMAETLGNLDNKIADLESENEALMEERLIMREKIKTITETITITHMSDNKKALEDKENKIDELLKELEIAREENSEMQKDMKKMFKSHGKSKLRMEELQAAEKAVRLLEVVAMLIHEIHGEVPDAGSQVSIRLDDVENSVAQLKQVLDTKQEAYQGWVDKYQEANGKTPGKADRDKDGEKLHGEWEVAKREYQYKHLHMSALQLIKTGDVANAVQKTDTARAEVEINNLEKALTSADNKIIDLETENKNLKADRDRFKDRLDDQEREIDSLKQQAELNTAVMADSESSAELTEQLSELQKKSDSFEAELMQERMSHVNTRDELETIRKQIDVLKEEIENEKQGMDAHIEAVKSGMEAQLGVKEEELKSVQTRNGELEEERLSKLPPDTAKEIKLLQDKLKQVEKEKSSTKSSSAALDAQMAELTTKLAVAGKNLETQRAANRELEAKLKAGRNDKEKETKRVSKHMEEKQQKASSEDKQRITMLVKRVKELEAKAGKGAGIVPVPVAGGAEKGSDGAAVHMMRRELKDKEAQIKQLEKELRAGGGKAAGGTGADKMKGTKEAKILAGLEKKLDFQMEKSEKLTNGLKAADEENKALQKELDEKSRNLAKVSSELKTLGLAAKEGVEAATKVKDLEKENKRLTEENNVVTKNYESERVLRKKYYNIVEDMKGKIRVYCRARPMSKSEMERGNKPVCKSVDEYSISVEATRGLKEFQYDQVFMENSTQEKIFEDTNNLIQSAVDGYNVCIFAYGQTGSGKTFTMIGDREQNFPGIAPRAFNRIFEMVEEVKSKFSIKVEAYMMELYNDKLIDLFSKPSGSDDEKLEIKKDKKGMVFVQGAVVKCSRNAKELFALFEEGSANRHTASTKMNAESSRSHLVIGITLEATNKNTGNTTKGKLSLVDLAGSERVGKTGAGAEQLKEAMSINKSLSALGDVISALSSEQQFIPYRNNKLTMLMQDSLGGNAKTLMFVNISPADYNMDETVISLTYASRVKLITNDASKNADNKEITRLKNVIAKLKKGENVEEEDV